MLRLRVLALIAAAATYALIVLGAWVRITGSGMACGNHWPLCNGRLIPSLSDLPTLIEWSHRLAALTVSVLVLGLAGYAFFYGRTGMPGAGARVRPALLAALLLVAQVLLGAVTVWLELPPAVVTLHLATALALLAALLITALRASPATPEGGSPPARRAAVAALALGVVVLLLGGATASLGAGAACQGFPLCSGRFWPSGAASGLPQIHWLHRLAAYALLLHLGGMAARMRRPPAWTTLGLATAQVVVAVVMVLGALPPEWRALHAAVGTALWASLVWLAHETGVV